ncbi:MAG: glutathione S-transferase family protein [Sandaracinaceae bacterium]
MSLTFYYSPMSTASTVHWSLEELGVPYEGVRVDLTSEADKRAKLGPVNPNLKVPVLVHDGVAIFESAAIQIYLGETFGVERGLYPEPGPKRGEALKWLVWSNVSLGEAMQRYLRNTRPEVDAALRNEKAGAQGKADVESLIGMVDGALEDRPYLLGDQASLADVHLASFLGWVGMCGIDVGPFRHVSRWLEVCSARPACVRSMAAQTEG